MSNTLLLRELANHFYSSTSDKASMRGKVALTETHLQFLEQQPGAVEHFVDLMYDTPNLDLIRNGCWLVQRHGVHLHKSL